MELMYNMKEPLKILIWFSMSLIYVIITIIMDAGGYITYHFNKSQYEKQEVIITRVRAKSKHVTGYFDYVVGGETKEGFVELNYWEQCGSKIVIAVDKKNGEYIRTTIHIDGMFFGGIILGIVDVVILYLFIIFYMKKVLDKLKNVKMKT